MNIPCSSHKHSTHTTHSYPIQCPVYGSTVGPPSSFEQFAVPGFFKAIDKDGSGSLDPAEVQRGFRRLGVDVQLGDPLWGMFIWAIWIHMNPCGWSVMEYVGGVDTVTRI